MQINAAVAEADVGLINEGQTVKFTVDAFPNQTFTGTVRQVRNAATANQSVVSYATIIDVNNESLKLKPGMTANVSIIVTEKNNVLRVANSALRVRVPAEFQPKAPTNGSDKSNGAVASTGQTDAERARAEQEILREVGFQRGTPATAEMTEKARALAKDKGLDPDLVVARMATPGGRGNRGGGGGGGRGGRGGGGGGGGGGSADRGFNNTVLVRSLYKVIDPAAKEKQLEQVSVTLGVSDGLMTEVLDGLQEGDTVLTGIITPNSTPVAQQPGSMQNPFQGGGRGMGGMGGGGGGRRGN
jgi:HlyD family secretion protein